MSGTRLLDEAEFLSCFSAPMRDVTAEPGTNVDIWPYVDGIDVASLGLKQLGGVTLVYRDGTGRFDHVLIETDLCQVFLAVVVDLPTTAVLGHKRLDVGELYGL